MTNRRNTIQKDLVKNAVYEMKRHVTANEVYEFLKKEYPTIGKGTVYRNLDILSEEGALRKVEVPDGANRFDITLKNHYHVRCIKCGEVSDVDMEPITVWLLSSFFLLIYDSRQNIFHLSYFSPQK